MKMLMNPHTGSVATEEDWRDDAENGGWDFDSAELFEVIPDGAGWWFWVTESDRVTIG